MPDQLLLLATMAGAFLSAAVAVLAITTPFETPAMRVARFARYTGRRGSPGAETEYLSARERLLKPLLERLINAAARAAPSELHRTISSELVMAGSRVSPTAFLGIRTILLFGVPGLAAIY